MTGHTGIYTPGMRIECRSAEWLVTRIDSANSRRDQVVYCVGVDDLNRGHEAAFLTQLDRMREVDPRATRLVPDDSNGYARAKLFLEAQLRQMPLTDPEPHLENIGAFTPMAYQKEAVQRALKQIRPRLLLADAVDLGKTIEVGMILAELMRRSQANRILVLAKKSMLSQFQAELSLDDRKKENLLAVIQRYTECDLQPIITLIDSDLPPRSGDQPVFPEEEIILTLHDESEQERLLKTKAW